MCLCEKTRPIGQLPLDRNNKQLACNNNKANQGGSIKKRAIQFDAFNVPAAFFLDIFIDYYSEFKYLPEFEYRGFFSLLFIYLFIYLFFFFKFK